MLEELAALEHLQWISWSKSLAEKESLSPERLERWKNLWKPYEELDDKAKEEDRKWARKALQTASLVAQQYFDKWANNLEKRLKRRKQE